MDEPARPDPADVDGEAAAWAARLNSEHTGRAEWTALQAWLAGDPARLPALAQAEKRLAGETRRS